MMHAYARRLGLMGTVVAGVVLAFPACGDSGTRSAPTASSINSTPTPTPELAIARSAERFASVDAYRMRFVIKATGLDGSIEGEAVYQRNKGTLYARITLHDSSASGSDLTESLFLPPDLYYQQADGAWLVQSPWNQGVQATDQLAGIGIVEPLLEYGTIASVVHDMARRDTDANAASARYRGKVKLSNLPLFAESKDLPEATVDLWIDSTSELPSKVAISIRGDDPGSISLEFTDYNDRDVAAPPPPSDARPLRDVQFPDAPCTKEALAGCLAAQTSIDGADSCAGNDRRVCLVPLGMVPADMVDHFVAHYRDEYGLTVTVLKPAAIPASLEDPLREQVDASGLIEYMGSLYPAAYADDQAVLIGLTPIDVYDATSTYRYVFGIKRTPASPKAVLSSARMDPLFYSEDADDELFETRTRTMLSKYIGFLYYRLELSADPTSPLYDSIGGPDDVDQMTGPLPVSR